MDHDQFGGRTDDDLFSDDIEPVDYEATSIPTGIETPGQDASTQQEPTPPALSEPPASTAIPPAQAPKSSLAQSRHAPRQQDKPRHSSNTSSNNQNNTSANHKPLPKLNVTDTSPASEAASSTTPSRTSTPTPALATAATGNNNSSNNNNNNKPPSNAPREPSKNTASAVSAARLNSGANPRTKLTEEELAARMERMRLLAAEKTRRFEEAQRDESEHAVAYARGMEEARKRRAEEAARRKIADEEKRRLDEERAKNRERKLKAMSMKEGGWDEGKADGQGDEGRRFAAFRGAFGGVRRNRSPQSQGSGLGGSRFAGSDGAGDDADGFGGRGRGGRGRAGKGGRGGRGGRGLFEYSDRDGEHDHARDAIERQQIRTGGPGQLAPKKVDLKAEDFPALPGSTAPKKVDTAWAAKPSSAAADFPLASPVGRWDEEVQAAADSKSPPS